MRHVAAKPVYLLATGAHLPGPPIPNERIDRYIGTVDRHSRRIRDRVLTENGIRTRHYGIDDTGASHTSTAAMAAAAIRECLSGSPVSLEEIGMLAAGTSGGDVAMPGFANMVQGELGAPPIETSSHHGICAAGVSALLHAHRAVSLGHHANVVVAAADFPSRMFKASRFAADGYTADFDSHFLRWMLSDGAGAMLLSDTPRVKGLTLQLKWVHLKSFSGELPVCMQVGYAQRDQKRSYLDYPSLAHAERDGAFLLRQDLRLLPHLFELGIHEYVRLATAGWLDPARIDYLLCHYSSERFAPVVADLLEKSGLDIPRSRWFSNLVERGNTGAASIFIMLADFLRQREVRAGQQILCFVPESGRFTVGFFLFEAVEAPAEGTVQRARASANATEERAGEIAPPHDPDAAGNGALSALLRALAQVWHDYRSRAWRTPLIRRIARRELTREEYLRWMACWIPQVREGSRWMREAAASLREPFAALRALIGEHAGEEQFDFRILYDDYRLAGGTAESIDDLRRMPGGEALNAFMHASAARPDPLDLLGAIYIIEGTGQRIIPVLLPMLQAQLNLPRSAFRFLEYHGQNDARHLARWLSAAELALAADPAAGERIVRTALRSATLYLMQFEDVL